MSQAVNSISFEKNEKGKEVSSLTVRLPGLSTHQERVLEASRANAEDLNCFAIPHQQILSILGL